MDELESNIRLLVQDIISKMDIPDDAAPAAAAPAEPLGPGIFGDIDSAIAAAKVAQEQLANQSLEDRTKMIAAMRQAALDNNELMSRTAVEETGFFDTALKDREKVANETYGFISEKFSPSKGASKFAIMGLVAVGLTAGLIVHKRRSR